MDLIKSQSFVKADGSTLDVSSALSNKELILIYFSAKWGLLSSDWKLKKFYEKVAKEGVEIINVSWDQSSEVMLDYMKENHGDWLSLKHDSDGSQGEKIYRTRAIITRSWFETALDYKPRILGLTFLVSTEKWGKKYTNRGL